MRSPVAFGLDLHAKAQCILPLRDDVPGKAASEFRYVGNGGRSTTAIDVIQLIRRANQMHVAHYVESSEGSRSGETACGP
ncbi:MAG: hypothetical protein AAGA48_24005 [Myxococcota bacterium]